MIIVRLEAVDARSIVNATVSLLASGGSTNHTIHLVAIARAAGIIINWDDIADLSAAVPLLARVYPNGNADVNHFHAAGGTSCMFRQLLDAGLMHADAKTVWGECFGSFTQESFVENDKIVWRESPQKPLDMDEVIHLIQDRNNPSVLLFMKDKKARDASAKALRSSEFRVITAESLDQVLINARQISHRFIVIESGIVEMDEDAIKTMLSQVSPFSQLVETDSNEKPTVLLEELSRLRASPVRRETATSGW